MSRMWRLRRRGLPPRPLKNPCPTSSSLANSLATRSAVRAYVEWLIPSALNCSRADVVIGEPTLLAINATNSGAKNYTIVGLAGVLVNANNFSQVLRNVITVVAVSCGLFAEMYDRHCSSRRTGTTVSCNPARPNPCPTTSVLTLIRKTLA